MVFGLEDITDVFLAIAPTTSVSTLELGLNVDDATVLIAFGIARSCCCCCAALSSRFANNRLVSGGGRLQNARLGEGGSDDGWRNTPPNDESENNGFFVGGSIEADVSTTEEFECSPLFND